MTEITTEFGLLKKMRGSLNNDGLVAYSLPIGEQSLPISEYLQRSIKLEFSGTILCSNCHQETKKSYSQGFCFPCSQKLAQCDMCIMKPETCHYFQGSCREPQWGEHHCMIPHYVYLANTSGLKVGITRHTQIPTRWIDQGATQALPIFKVSTRMQSGLIETALGQHIADKTNWREMLKGDNSPINLHELANRLIPDIDETLNELTSRFSLGAIERMNADVIALNYPVESFPTKIHSLSFDKTTIIEGKLLGIKGQYLILDCGVINIRKFGAYQVKLSVS
ncbi:DUF2797 domain-containing protein [Thalassotalea ganghwensis]